MSKRFKQIAKPPVDESLLLLKNLIRRSKNSRGWVASSLLATHENAAATACAVDASRSGREPGARTPGRAGAGTSPGGEREAGAESGARAGAGCGPWTGASPGGGEREAEAESGGAGNKTYLL